MKTFLVRLMCLSKRPGEDLGNELKAKLKGRGPGHFMSFQELRQQPKELAFAQAGYSFVVMSVVIQTPHTAAELDQKLLDLRNQSDPYKSQVRITEMPEIAAVRCWYEMSQNPKGCAARIAEFFPWYAGHVGS